MVFFPLLSFQMVTQNQDPFSSAHIRRIYTTEKEKNKFMISLCAFPCHINSANFSPWEATLNQEKRTSGGKVYAQMLAVKG